MVKRPSCLPAVATIFALPRTWIHHFLSTLHLDLFRAHPFTDAQPNY